MADNNNDDTALPNFFGSSGAGTAAGFGQEEQMDIDGEQILCSIKCGRLHKHENKMRSDPQKGKLRVVRGIDSLVRIQYGVRDPSIAFEAEEDIIIFPQECLSKTMKQPNCFSLKFIEDSSRDMYFWFQEKFGEDAEGEKNALLQRLNESLNQLEPSMATGHGHGQGGMMDEPDFEQQLRDAIAASQMPPDTPVNDQQQQEENNEDEDELYSNANDDKSNNNNVAAASNAINNAGMDLETPVVGASNTAPRAPQKEAAFGTMNTSNASEMAAAMAASMSGIRVPAFGDSPVLTQQQQQGSLKDILKPEIVGPILRNKEVRDRLLEHLPEEHRETADLEDLIRTPQFSSQLERFSEALRSGQMDLSQFGLKSDLNSSPIADLRTFLKAIQDQVKENENEKSDAAMEG